MATALCAVTAPSRAGRSHGDRAQITRGCGRPLHVTIVLVDDNKHLLNNIIDLACWDTKPMKQASHERRMLAEELLRGYPRW
jgi:hypothetical protein